MKRTKYVGMDVHKATISVAVRDPAGKLTMESVIETKAATILEFVRGLGGSVSVTFEEGTGAGWLSDLLRPHVNEVIVCDPRKMHCSGEGTRTTRWMPGNYPNSCVRVWCLPFITVTTVCELCVGDCLRTVLAVKGLLCRACRRGLDSSGPF